MTRNTKTLFNKNRYATKNHLSGRTLLLAMVSSLLLAACSEPNAAAGDDTSIAEPVATVQTAPATQPKANQSQTPIMLTGAPTSSTALQNVSATVYKDANCGCCKAWIEHAESHGMEAVGQDVTDLTVFKQRYNVPNNMQSCHTTVTTDGYVFEGHVPAKHVAQFLKNPPADAIGLAVPGMPMGSPGMEYNDQFDPYHVMQINKDGSSTVYAEIESPVQQL